MHRVLSCYGRENPRLWYPIRELIAVLVRLPEIEKMDADIELLDVDDLASFLLVVRCGKAVQRGIDSNHQIVKSSRHAALTPEIHFSSQLRP